VPTGVAPESTDAVAGWDWECGPTTEAVIVHRADDLRYFPLPGPAPECPIPSSANDLEPRAGDAGAATVSMDSDCDETCWKLFLQCAATHHATAVARLRDWDAARSARRAAEVAGETGRAAELRTEEENAAEVAAEWLDVASSAWLSLLQLETDRQGTDEAWFQVGWEFEYLLDLTDDPGEAERNWAHAWNAFNALVRDFPASDRLPAAWLSLADLLMTWSSSSYPVALENYDRVLALDSGSLRGYALYQKARCLRQLDRDDEARETLDELREWLSENPDAAGADELREALCRESPSLSTP
jgi:tetratricopeptide (TPR) repeat protein